MPEIKGVIYAKYTKPWASGKGESHYIVLEHTESVNKKFFDKKAGEWKETFGSDTNYIVIKLGRGMSLDEYSLLDYVDVRYKIRGIKYDKKDGSGEGFFNELETNFIKFADIEGGHSSKSNTGGFGKPFPKRDDTFTPPDPDADDTMQDLPF